MTERKVRIENAYFLEFAVKKIWMGAGASQEHAGAVARAIIHGDRMGKTNQGIGVFEALTIVLRAGNLDIKAKPEIVNEGHSWIIVDGNKSSGHYTLTMAMKRAMEKAKESGVCMALCRNHFDAGCFSAYSSMALEQDMIAIATNNSVPMATPIGGMENIMSCAPVSAVCPAGEESPIIVDIKTSETYDGEISEAYYHGQKIPKKILVDPDAGELTDDPAPYFVEIDGYGRLSDCKAASTFDTYRLQSINILFEMLTGLLVPGSQLPHEIPMPIACWAEKQDVTPVGGSFLLVIDPSKFMTTQELKDKADRYISTIKNVKKAPWCNEIFLPGERALMEMKETSNVNILETHWGPFVEIAKEVGLDIDELRKEWEAQR